MSEDRKPLWRELLPHAVWDAIKELCKKLLSGSVGAAVIAAIVAAWERAKHVSPDWLFIGTVFVSSLVVVTVLLYVATKQRGATKAEIFSIVTELLAQKGESSDSITQLPSSLPNQVDSKATDERPVLDAEIYRISTTGKAMSDVVSLTRSLYEMRGQLKDFAIDADVLVELYVVNTSTTKRYIRDFIGTVEIDGKEVPLARQRDFYAWDSSNRSYEYCLTLGDDKYDRSSLETLPNLSSRLNEALEPGSPIEGWIRFLVTNIDPEKLTDNRSYKFFVMDSLGNQYPILKAVPTKRPGEVTVRQIEPR